MQHRTPRQRNRYACRFRVDLRNSRQGVMFAQRWPSSGRKRGTGAPCRPQQMPISSFGITRTGQRCDHDPEAPEEEAAGGPYQVRVQGPQPDRLAELLGRHLRYVLRPADGGAQTAQATGAAQRATTARRFGVPSARAGSRRMEMVRRFLGRIFWASFVLFTAASCGAVITLAATGKL